MSEIAFQLDIDSGSLPGLLDGYKVLVERGERPGYWQQLVDAVETLTKQKAGRPKGVKDGQTTLSKNSFFKIKNSAALRQII
jgi:hypothetical protein